MVFDNLLIGVGADDHTALSSFCSNRPRIELNPVFNSTGFSSATPFTLSITLPALAIAAHKKTLEALAELARRVEKVEKRARK
jgi:6-phosphogluconolactonase/glucosamine-6-phosphate isomerase/deaminase